MTRKFAAALMLFVGLALLGVPAPDEAHAQSFEQQERQPESRAERPQSERGDIRLYRAIAAKVANGESYYREVTRLHRERNYPLRPFYTVRLPTLAYMSAMLGQLGLILTGWGIVFVSVYVWYTRDRDAPLTERLFVAALLAMGGATFVMPDTLFLHEAWCGLLLTLALGFYAKGNWWPALVTGALALLIREFALIFVAAIGLFALIERQWLRVGAVFGVGLTFLGAMSLHAREVARWVQPEDLASPPWKGLRGPEGLVEDLQSLSYFGLFPNTLAIVLAAATALGWLALPRKQAVFAAVWLGSGAMLVMLFARENNFYWATIMLPAFTLGLAFAFGALQRRLVRGTQLNDNQLTERR